MALELTIKETTFGVGDKVKILQKIHEGKKSRSQTFEGMVLSIRGEGDNKTFLVRRIGAAQVGIERIFPANLPTIEKIEVLKKGTRGVTRAKLFYTRGLAKREIDKIYTRAARRSKKQ